MCNGGLRIPVLQSLCGHRFCSVCFYSFGAVQNLACPGNDPDCLQLSWATVFKDVAMDRELQTRNCCENHLACRKVIESQDDTFHKNTCPFALIACPFSMYGCPVEVSQGIVNKHASHECRYRLELCKFCATEFPSLRLSAHEAECYQECDGEGIKSEHTRPVNKKARIPEASGVPFQEAKSTSNLNIPFQLESGVNQIYGARQDNAAKQDDSTRKEGSAEFAYNSKMGGGAEQDDYITKDGSAKQDNCTKHKDSLKYGIAMEHQGNTKQVSTSQQKSKVEEEDCAELKYEGITENIGQPKGAATLKSGSKQECVQQQQRGINGSCPLLSINQNAGVIMHFPTFEYRNIASDATQVQNIPENIINHQGLDNNNSSVTDMPSFLLTSPGLEQHIVGIHYQHGAELVSDESLTAEKDQDHEDTLDNTATGTNDTPALPLDSQNSREDEEAQNYPRFTEAAQEQNSSDSLNREQELGYNDSGAVDTPSFLLTDVKVTKTHD